MNTREILEDLERRKRGEVIHVCDLCYFKTRDIKEAEKHFQLGVPDLEEEEIDIEIGEIINLSYNYKVENNWQVVGFCLDESHQEICCEVKRWDGSRAVGEISTMPLDHVRNAKERYQETRADPSRVLNVSERSQ